MDFLFLLASFSAVLSELLLLLLPFLVLLVLLVPAGLLLVFATIA